MSRIDPEIEDCLIRLENQMYGFGGAAGRSASSDRYAVEEHIRGIDGYEQDARRENVKLKAYVHSLRAERDEALSDCDLMRAICERRTAERDRLREALEVIAKLGATDGLNAKVIARRALEGDTTP